MRKTHSKEFKFKVAIESVRVDLSVAEIVSKYQVAPSLVHKWKTQLMSNGFKVFDSEKNNSDAANNARDVEKLHAKIGKLTLENDFLERALSKVR